MLYHKTLELDPELSSQIKKAITWTDNDPVTDRLEEQETISVTVTFDNKLQMDIKCCGCTYENKKDNAAWTEAVLFNEHGQFLCCSEPSDTFFTDWELSYNQDIYKVTVKEKC